MRSRGLQGSGRSVRRDCVGNPQGRSTRSGPSQVAAQCQALDQQESACQAQYQTAGESSPRNGRPGDPRSTHRQHLRHRRCRFYRACKQWARHSRGAHPPCAAIHASCRGTSPADDGSRYPNSSSLETANGTSALRPRSALSRWNPGRPTS